MYYYIVNPSAGNGKINKIQVKLQSLLKEKKIDGEFIKSTGKGDALKIAKMAVERGSTTIVAVGGDGTVSEVVNGIINYPDIVLGILPIGSTNILANALGIYDWIQAVNILAQRRVKTISLGKVNDNYFITSLEIGFETSILKDKKSSFFAKNKNIKSILSYKPFNAEIKFDGGFSINSDIFNLSVFNAKVSNDGQETFLNVGKLNILLVPLQSKFNLIKNIPQIFKKSYDKLPFISKFKARKINVNTGKTPQEVFVDAEYIGMTPVEISASSKKLKVIVSKDRKFD